MPPKQNFHMFGVSLFPLLVSVNNDYKSLINKLKNIVFNMSPCLTLFFTCSLLIPLKTSENQKFSDVFRGIKRENWEEKD